MKRRLTKLVVFLFLGAVVNVAMAWGCAAWLVTSGGVVGGWTHARPSELALGGMVGADFTDNLPSGALLLCNGVVATSFGAEEVMLSISEEWRADGRELWRSAYRRIAIGWPLRSVDEVVWKLGTDASGAFKRSKFPTDRRSRVLAFRPIWPGFAINTIFYAPILWLLALGPFTARRMIRRKRGHCLNCGYDLRGAEHKVCPECGCETRKPVGAIGQAGLIGWRWRLIQRFICLRIVRSGTRSPP